MARYSVRQVLIFTAQVALGLTALANASPLVSQFATICLVCYVTANALLALQTVGRSKRISACICTIGSYLSLHGWSIPPLLYLCAPPFGWYEFYDVEGLWNTFCSAASIIIGISGGHFGYTIARTTSRKIDAAIGNLARPRFLLPVTCFGFLTSGYLVSFNSPLVASICNFVCIILFYLAITGSIYGTAASRLFAISFGVTVLSYLVLAAYSVWPYSYYLGPAPYLYRYYPSAESSWATAQSMFALLLGLYVGSIAFRLALRDAPTSNMPSPTADIGTLE
jgi:hypothetical protein